MKEFPGLVPQELELEGRGYQDAAADIKLSSAGKNNRHLVVITDEEHCDHSSWRASFHLVCQT